MSRRRRRLHYPVIIGGGKYRASDHYPYGVPLFSRAEIKKMKAWAKRQEKKRRDNQQG